MQKNLLFSLSFLAISFLSRGTIHIVNVANLSFSPASISNVIVGDTVRWCG